MLNRCVVSLSLTICTFLAAFARAEAPVASTLYIEKTETQFSLNIANDSEDVSIFFTSPAFSWVAVGFGAGMKNSLSLIMYPSSGGNNVTISPRIAGGNQEPVFDPSIRITALPDTGIIDDMMVLKAICHDCRAWYTEKYGGSMLNGSQNQPMIYAFGPAHRLQSNSPRAPLKRHVRYGRFTMDLRAASGVSGVPEPSTKSKGVTLLGGMTKDKDRANRAHAVMGCMVLFILWPINTLVHGFIRRTSIHLYVSIFLVVFLVCSYGLGIATSAQYNRSKDFKSAHQILAFLSIPFILLIPILPLQTLSNILPTAFPRFQAPTTFLIFTLLLITGGLGLHLSASPTSIILVFTCLSLFILLTLLVLQTIIWKCGRNRNRHGRTRSSSRRHSPQEDDDDQDLVLAAYYAGQGLKEQQSRSTLNTPTPSSHEYSPGAQQQTYGQGYKSHSPSGSRSNIYGGGTMPGPQYLLNMHPGVPVHRFD